MSKFTFEATTVGGRLKLYLFAHDIGQRVVAKATGQSHSTISRIMNNKNARRLSPSCTGSARVGGAP